MVKITPRVAFALAWLLSAFGLAGCDSSPQKQPYNEVEVAPFLQSSFNDASSAELIADQLAVADSNPKSGSEPRSGSDSSDANAGSKSSSDPQSQSESNSGASSDSKPNSGSRP